ncbi:hypothetical protein ABDZ99_06870 (plasmid) [Sphingomonas parapaucimobilis]
MGATADAEGIRVVDVTSALGIPTSQVVIRISEATMKDAAKVPYSGELGSASTLFYDFIATFGQDRRRLVYGTFTALPTVYGMDSAPANRPQGGQPAQGDTWNSARVTFGDNVVRVVIDGADLLVGETAKAVDAAQEAVAASQQAVQVVAEVRDHYRAATFGATVPGVRAVRGVVRGLRGRIIAAWDDRHRWLVNGLFLPRGGAVEMYGEGDRRGMLLFGTSANWRYALTDRAGRVMFGLKDGDVHLAQVGPSARLRMLFEDQALATRARAVTETRHGAKVANLTGTRLLSFVYGQSLGAGTEAWPALTRTAQANTYMYGGSVRPQNSYSGVYQPVPPDNTISPLVATVEKPGYRLESLTDAQVAALPRGDYAEGEEVSLHVARGLAGAWDGRAIGATKQWFAANVAVAGRTIEQLSDGYSEDHFKRIEDLVAYHRNRGQADNIPTSIVAWFWMQGENNFGEATSDRTYAGYKAKLATLRGQVNTAVGQDLPPAMFTYVTAGSYVRDEVQLSISMAQVDFALETPGVWCFGPTYPYTDKGGHLDSNGERWIGLQAAKVARHVLVDGKGWQPTHERWIKQVGRTVYVGIHAPRGPLQFQPYYDRSTPTMRDDRGFRVSDMNGDVAVEAVEILGSSVIAIRCARRPLPGALVWYASEAAGGSGNVCDSDPTLAPEGYEYRAESGMYAEADRPELVGRPYPLFNWLSPFCRPIGFART